MKEPITFLPLESLPQVTEAFVQDDWDGLMIKLQEHGCLAVVSEDNEIVGVLVLPEIYERLSGKPTSDQT